MAAVIWGAADLSGASSIVSRSEAREDLGMKQGSIAGTSALARGARRAGSASWPR